MPHRDISIYIIYCFLAIVIFSFGCEKEHGELAFTNPFDPMNPETHGDPYNLRIAFSADSIILQWDNIPGVRVVDVYRSNEPNGIFKVIGTSTDCKYIDTDIQPGLTYYYRLEAHSG